VHRFITISLLVLLGGLLSAAEDGADKPAKVKAMSVSGTVVSATGDALTVLVKNSKKKVEAGAPKTKEITVTISADTVVKVGKEEKTMAEVADGAGVKVKYSDTEAGKSALTVMVKAPKEKKEKKEKKAKAEAVDETAEGGEESVEIPEVP
jgi:hypothetical protein